MTTNSRLMNLAKHRMEEIPPFAKNSFFILLQNMSWRAGFILKLKSYIYVVIFLFSSITVSVSFSANSFKALVFTFLIISALRREPLTHACASTKRLLNIQTVTLSYLTTRVRLFISRVFYDYFFIGWSLEMQEGSRTMLKTLVRWCSGLWSYVCKSFSVISFLFSFLSKQKMI